MDSFSDNGNMLLSKSIDELYSEVKGCSLVITKDISLATALNSRNDGSRLGPFALTPRQLARSVSLEIVKKPVLNELDTILAVKAVLSENGKEYPEKLIYSEILNIRSIRRYHLDLTSVGNYLHTSFSRDIFEAYSKIDNILENVMTDPRIKECSLFKEGSDVAVIGSDMFDGLESSVIPVNVRKVSLFKTDRSGKHGSYDKFTVYKIGNDRQLAEHAADIIKGNDPSDFAIVFDTSSEIANCVRKALYQNDISFINRPKIIELECVRRYLRFIGISLSYDIVKVKDTLSLFTELGIKMNGLFGKRYLKDVRSILENDQKYHQFNTIVPFMEQICRGKKRFSDVLTMMSGDRYGIGKDRKFDEDENKIIKDIIDYIGDSVVTEDTFSLVRYILSNLSDLHSDMDSVTRRTGVLLADCNKATYIDRPAVIYLGMDSGWDRKMNMSDHVSLEMVERDSEIECRRFTVMMQQGSSDSRYYLANITKDGKLSRPALIFSRVLERPIKEFSDIDGCTVKEGRWKESLVNDVPALKTKGVREYTDKFSKSSFNNYMYCPCKFSLSRVIGSSDSENTVFGNAVHAFAEFYACYRDEYKKDISPIIDALKKLYPMISDDPLDKMNIKNMVTHISRVKEFLDGMDLSSIGPLVEYPEKDRWGNGSRPLFTLMGKNKCSRYCETEEFESQLHMIKGKMDLFISGIVLDYKTGAPDNKTKKAEKIINKAIETDPSKVNKDTEYQPIFYLAIAEENGSEHSSFILYHTVDDKLENRFAVLNTGFYGYNPTPFKIPKGNLGMIPRDLYIEILDLIDHKHQEMMNNARIPMMDVPTYNKCNNCGYYRYCLMSKDEEMAFIGKWGV